jgi:hypothetical protein
MFSEKVNLLKIEIASHFGRIWPAQIMWVKVCGLSEKSPSNQLVMKFEPFFRKILGDIFRFTLLSFKMYSKKSFFKSFFLSFLADLK